MLARSRCKRPTASPPFRGRRLVLRGRTNYLPALSKQRAAVGLNAKTDPNYVSVVSRIFRTFNLAERNPASAHAVTAPLICWSKESNLKASFAGFQSGNPAFL